ncbi:MAG: DNA mismatch repair protein MutS [Bacilli bacterium]
MKISDIDINKLTPMMKQYVDIKLQNIDKIIFFRLGEFYEMFFEDATLVSAELEIALTGKRAGLDKRIPMCGVPAHSYLNYLEKLVEKGYKVAIVEQLEEAGTTKLVKRGIVQIITPGTIIKDCVNTASVGCYIKEKDKNVLCYTNISTGELFCKIINGKVEPELIKNDVKEVVTDLDISKQFVISSCHNISKHDSMYNNCDPIFHTCIDTLVSYIEVLYANKLKHLKPAETIVDDLKMKLDLNAVETLELIKTTRNEEKFGSLYWYLDKTSTAMGSRMLRSWILHPLRELKSIEYRQTIIRNLIENFIVLSDLQKTLKDVYDLERICAKISVGSANARDLLWLKSSLVKLPRINELLKLAKIGLEIEEFEDIVHLLENSISSDAPITLREGKLIKHNYNSSLDELKDIALNGKQWLIDLEQREKARTGIKNLKVKYNKVFGFFIEVSNSNLHLIKDEYGYERKQTLTNGERFITSELKEQEEMILNVDSKLITMEYELFIEIRNFIKDNISKIQKSAITIAMVDCLTSLAYVADSEKLVAPTFNNNEIIDIKGCRHPVVEKATNTIFVENDVTFASDQNMMLITGPNMSGKSTYMRQVAICAIMAQMGGYVACDYANLMVFDAIYTRIGAKDDLSSGKSTFLLEMLEANYAIENASRNSLIIFDELGRGTSTYDGMSISHAIIEYMSKNVCAKTLFSTHYHELTSLENKIIFNVHASVLEENGEITFKHRIVNGAASKSYGIYVAKLAKLPNAIIGASYKALKHYESVNHEESQVKFEYIKVESEVEKTLSKLDINNLSPIEALNKLSELKEKIR